MTTPSPRPDPVGPSSAEDIAGQLGTVGVTPSKATVWLGDYVDRPAVDPGGLIIGAPRTGSPFAPTPTVKVENRIAIEDAEMMYFNFTPQQREALIAMSVKLGYIRSDSVNDAALQQVWAQYVKSAAAYQAKGKNWTPWSIMLLDSMTQEKTKKEVTQKGPVTQTSTSTDLSTKMDARGILNTASRTLLGRDPTEEESNRFWQTLNAAERENPVTTTQTTTYDAEGNVATQNSTSSGGMSAQAKEVVTEDTLKANPEYGAYQAATNYMGILRNMVYGGQ
jgi:nicotinamide mononucleotide adenylyltransferase